MKKLRQWINVRRDRRLRKWCVKIVGNQEGLGYGMKLKKNDAAIGNHQRNVGNYGSVFGRFTSILGKVTGTVAAAVGVFKMVEPVFNSTQKTGDELRFTIAEIDGVYQTFLKSVAGGGLDLFVRNLEDAAKAGRKLAVALDAAFERENSINIPQTGPRLFCPARLDPGGIDPGRQHRRDGSLCEPCECRNRQTAGIGDG